MASAQADPYGPLLEKLQLPHPLIQRFAVATIFEKFKSGPVHTNLESPLGQEAFTRCLASTETAVIDQSVKEVCKFCADGGLPVERGMRELQAALDAVSSECVASLMNGIGFLCRLFLRRISPGSSFMSKSGDVVGVGFHPLIKCFQSRTDELQHVLQQAGSLLVKASSDEQRIINLDFLQPFFAFILLQPLSSPSHVLFARDLHSQLCLLACQSHGQGLLEMLINYVHLYPTHVPQGREFVVGALRDLTDVLENLVMQTEGVQQNNTKELERLGSQLLGVHVRFCHELLSHKVSLYPALVLIKRLMKSLRVPSLSLSDSAAVSMVSIAHMLAMVDLEQEQLLLLDLGLDWLDNMHSKGKNAASTRFVALLWVFPALHVMSYPSVSVKSLAARLLQALEGVVGIISRSENKVGALEVNLIRKELGSLVELHQSADVYRLLQMWSEEETAVIWVPGLTANAMTTQTSAEQWLRNLTSHMIRCSQRARTVDLTLNSMALSRGVLVSLCTLVTVFLLHSNVKVSLAAAEALASIGKAESIWGMSLLPVGLFCVRFQGKVGGPATSEVQLGLLKVFPSLACHSATLPLVLQVLQPMLVSKSDVIVQATAVRLLCKTWEFNDLAFPHLQKLLRPGDMKGNLGRTELCQSRAACIRDVSRKDPDKGVDLVLSIQASIESKDPLVQSLGLQSLVFLCKEDVIDFYTAWLLLSNLFPNLPEEPLVLQSLCMLLKYGALDAAAHPEAAAGVLEILWKVATRNEKTQKEDLYSGARAAAFESLAFFKVDDLETLCPDEKGKEVELLFSETSVIVLPFLEELLNTALIHEHTARQRGRKEIKVADTKLRKLLKAFPGALNSAGFAPKSGKIVTSVSEFPGSALLCISLPPPIKTEQVPEIEFQKRLKTWQANHEKIFQVAVDQLNFGRNLVLAVLSFQSWCSFISRWLHSMFTVIEAENPKIGCQESMLRAAKHLAKIMQESCEAGIPRIAESATVALAALCKVMPTHTHKISENVSVFLESRLLQEEHEHMLWSAALALGWVATCLHATDWQRKHEIVQHLLKHAGTSDRGIVRGACGLALGIICQSLLRQKSSLDSGMERQRETELLLHIVLSLIQLASETCPTAAPALRKVLGLLRSEVLAKEKTVLMYPLPQKGSKLEEEKFWAVVGIVWGLGSTVTALQQLQCPTLLVALTDLMISWVSEVPESHNEADASLEDTKQEDVSGFFLAAGACLVLSTCVEVSSRLEILKVDANVILQRVIALIICCTDPNISADMEHWRSPLFSALYIGAGNLLATLLQDGAQSIKLALIQSLLKTMQAGAEMADHGGWSQLGAMIGIANSLGAGAALLGPSKRGQQLADLHNLSRVKVDSSEQSAISRPLLHEAVIEDYVSLILRNLQGVVRSEQSSRLRSYAGWALAFTHNGFFGGGELEGGVEEFFSSEGYSEPRQSGYHMRGLQDFPEESILRLLCTKFFINSSMPPTTMASVFRCLEKAPRLPALDWGGLTRRSLKQNQSISESVEKEYNVGSHIAPKSKLNGDQKEARRQCVLFAVAHAEQIPALASFLDELSELSRLGTLESSLRNLIVSHLFRLHQIFSPSRLKQLLRDVQVLAVKPTGLADFLVGDDKDIEYERQSFRESLWKGLAAFFEDSTLNQHDGGDEVLSCVEECMTALIDLLPSSIWTDHATQTGPAILEWSAAIMTLAKGNKSWLLKALQMPIISDHVLETGEEIESVSRAVFGRCQLVAAGCLPVGELKSCHQWLMSRKSSGMLKLLVTLAWATREAPLKDRQEWLLDSLDTAIISPFPTTVVLFTALLTSSWCSLPMSLDPMWAIQNLPLSFPSLLSNSGWTSVVESGAYKLTLLLDRLEASFSNNDSQGWEVLKVLNSQIPILHLFSLLRRTCIELKRYLPQEVKLNLAHSLSSSIRIKEYWVLR